MDVAILCPISVEYTAVRAFLEHCREEQKDGEYYTAGAFRGKHHQYRIVLRQSGSRNSEVALAAERTIRHYRPALVLLAGIAGGVKDVAIGDVVVGTQAYGYEAGKSTGEGFSSRPNVLPYSRGLIELARAVARSEAWLQRLPSTAPPPRVFFGPIASGDQVVASTRSEVYSNIKAHYNDTLALEMESIGFARAVAGHPQVQAANIRGISDLLDGKNPAHDLDAQPRAAAHAAAFLFELLYQLDLSTITTTPMDANTVAKQAVSLLFPLLKLDSVKQAGKEFRQAIDGTLLEIWNKVKPIFIEEIEAEDIPDQAQGAIRSALRRNLEQDDSLKQQLETLLKQLEEKGAGNSSVVIENSKNVVQGSNINVGGDFRLGDG
ncbi:MAG: 5'-methylthioadenosine/S-adenosylhomocysteine nucleosidase [Lewinellaceae bacterium]|nr:5'-methylthioadenosine/S-adenosylhomocysteine nucleosidase [Lewinellaceae bacterium]